MNKLLLVVWIGAIVVLAIMPNATKAVTIEEPANDRSYVPIFVEYAQGCVDWSAQLAQNTRVQGTGAAVIFDHFGMQFNPLTGVRYTWQWNDTITGVFHDLVGEEDVAYNQFPTSSGPVTSFELFQSGGQNFTACKHHGAYRDSSLSVHTVHPENVDWFTANKGPLVPGNNALGCDMMAADYFLLTRGGRCAPMEVHLWAKDGKSDYDENADLLALGCPVRWTITPWLNGAILGLPVDVKVADVWFRQCGNIYYELLMFNPLFFQQTEQTRKRSDAPLALPKTWILNKLARYAPQVTAMFPQHASTIDAIVATQM